MSVLHLPDTRVRQQLLPLVGAAAAFRAIASRWLAPQLKLLIFRTSILDTADILFLLRQRRCYDVLLLYFSRIITVLHEQVEILLPLFVIVPCKQLARSIVNIHYEPPSCAGCCYRRHPAVGGAKHITPPHTTSTLPVLKMSLADTTNSLAVNRDCFRTFRHCVRHGRLF